MFIPHTSNGASIWSIQVTSLVGLGRMESEFSLRNRSCDFWCICQRLALFSATHQAAPIISMCTPRDAQQQGKYRTTPRMCILWNTIRAYPLLGFCFPKLCHWYLVQAIKFAKYPHTLFIIMVTSWWHLPFSTRLMRGWSKKLTSSENCNYSYTTHHIDRRRKFEVFLKVVIGEGQFVLFCLFKCRS